MPACIDEHFFKEKISGKIKFFQPEDGYRFSMDTVFLADYVKPEKGQKILDIGTGSGIIPVILALKYPEVQITGVEIQEELAETAIKNVILNHLEKNISILHRDINKTDLIHINGTQDIIISNPPYKKKGSGRLNHNMQKAIARHEINLSLDELAQSVKKLLSPEGCFYLIYPAERLSELICILCQYRIVPDQIRFIHTKKNAAAKRVMAKCIRNGSGTVTVLPPLYVNG